MSIVRIEKRELPYVIIDKRPLNDESLSWGARGIMAYLLSKPDNWVVRIDDLMNQGGCGRRKIQNYLRELRDAGYAQLTTNKKDDSSGKMAGKEWVIFEQKTDRSKTNLSEQKTDRSKNRSSVKPTVGKMTCIVNNDSLKNNDIRKEEREREPAENPFKKFCELYGVQQNSKLSIEWCKVDQTQTPEILKHLPGYLSRTSAAGGKKKQRSNPINYLKNQLWLNDPNPTEKEAGRLPNGNYKTFKYLGNVRL